jgi:hypothetical protein
MKISFGRDFVTIYCLLALKAVYNFSFGRVVVVDFKQAPMRQSAREILKTKQAFDFFAPMVESVLNISGMMNRTPLKRSLFPIFTRWRWEVLWNRFTVEFRAKPRLRAYAVVQVQRWYLKMERL